VLNKAVETQVQILEYTKKSEFNYFLGMPAVLAMREKARSLPLRSWPKAPTAGCGITARSTGRSSKPAPG
jgi:hypothetical protein